MKNRKGFTLIELLAIIVILAIIAVITVPIILGIVDEAKKGTAKDSAYGYKDAVNKFYTSKLLQNKDYSMQDKTYSISELNTLGVSVSGNEPEGDSWVKIKNNNVISACLQFDDYKVDIVGGNVDEVTKGECIEQLPCTGEDCVYAVYTVKMNYNPNGTSGSILTDYTMDYTTFSDHHGYYEDRYFFLGHILGEDGRINRGFVCSIVNDKPFCIEGTLDGSKNNINMKILQSLSIGNLTEECFGDSGYYPCTYNTGNVQIGVNGPSGGCSVSSEGKMWCK